MAKRTQFVCSVIDCDRQAHARNLCSTHYGRLERTGTVGPPVRISIEDRFWAKVDKSGDCWLWTAAKNNQGYGVFGIPGNKKVLPHRFSYELVKGPIPLGLTIDHLCRTPLCVNPDHLEAVTHRVNNLRGASQAALNAQKTYCPKGHAYSGDNLFVWKNTWGWTRRCRTCKNQQQRERRRMAAS